jgi:hypothetical protein
MQERGVNSRKGIYKRDQRVQSPNHARKGVNSRVDIYKRGQRVHGESQTPNNSKRVVSPRGSN